MTTISYSVRGGSNSTRYGKGTIRKQRVEYISEIKQFTEHEVINKKYYLWGIITEHSTLQTACSSQLTSLTIIHSLLLINL